ncbi:MAG: type II secretion system protein [Fibrobacteria bacterium]
MAALGSDVSKPPAQQRGFTLIEVLVAATILGMTVSAVAIMIINSSVIRTTNDHFRQARTLVQQQLENFSFSYQNYPQPTGVVSTYVQMDFAEAPLPSVADTIRRSVSNQTQLGFPAEPGFPAGVSVPYQRISVSVTWSENTQSQTVRLRKRVVQLP